MSTFCAKRTAEVDVSGRRIAITGVFGFLKTDANAIVAPIHPKGAVPVILITPAEVDRWLELSHSGAARVCQLSRGFLRRER
jgi:putative SOS response-associated peptidase YedK